MDTLSGNNNHFTIVVTQTGCKNIVGTATLLVEPKLIHNISNVGHIEDVVVDSQCRGKHIGKLMLEYLVNKSEKLGCYKVILDCDDKNVAFYSKCNFTKKGAQMAIYFDK